jgi:hypothetical protein
MQNLLKTWFFKILERNSSESINFYRCLLSLAN